MNLKHETINNYFERKINKYGNNEALILPEENKRYTYKDIKTYVNNIAKTFLTLGIKKGDHIAVYSHNSPEYILLTLGIMKIGGIVVGLNNDYNRVELNSTLYHSDAVLLITTNENSSIVQDIRDTISKNKENEYFPFLKAILSVEELFSLSNILSQIDFVSNRELDNVSKEVVPEDIAMMFYTSGTTAMPKAVIQTHESILNGIRSFAKNFKYDENDKIFSALPLFHMMGYEYTSLLALSSGSSVVFTKKFKTSMALEIIQKEKCTSFHGVPTMYQFFLSKYTSYDISSLKKGFIAGASCSKDLLNSLRNELGIEDIFVGYGQTETLGVTQTRISDSDEKKVTTVGKPVAYNKLKVVNPSNFSEELQNNEKGLIFVNSPFIMKGYYKEPEKTKATIIDGWVNTGDLGYLDNDGYLVISGREKDIIIRGGENISPIEIEEVLLKHPAIKNAAVIGVPDDLLGEEICAFLILEKDQQISEKEIQSYVLNNLAKYKKPKYVRFIDKFPLTSSNKIKKNELKSMFVNKK